MEETMNPTPVDGENAVVTKYYLVCVDATGDAAMRSVWVLELLHMAAVMLLLGRSVITLRGRLKWSTRLVGGAWRLALTGKCEVPGEVA